MADHGPLRRRAALKEACPPRLAGIDWVAIAIYFGILLGVATWVVRKGKDSAADYFLAGRNLGWWVIGASIFASNIGSEHVVGWRAPAPPAASPWRTMNCTPGVSWSSAWVFVPFYMRSKVFTMPEFLERRFSEKSRYVLSIVSIITFIVSKIAVGIFAGGVVFGTLFPRCHHHRRPDIDSFWIGSVLVIVLTGLYTTLGGMRAVAYNDAVQVIVLIVGSSLLTIMACEPGRVERASAYLRLRYVQPLEAADPGGRRRAPGRRCSKPTRPARSSSRPGISTTISRGWECCSARPSSDCGTGVRISTSCSAPSAPPTRRPRAAAASSPRSLNFPGISVHHSRPDVLRPGEKRQNPRARP